MNIYVVKRTTGNMPPVVLGYFTDEFMAEAFQRRLAASIQTLGFRNSQECSAWVETTQVDSIKDDELCKTAQRIKERREEIRRLNERVEKRQEELAKEDVEV